jgi:hypothetical protein
MPKSKKIRKSEEVSYPLETTYTDLPGLKGVKVIISYPMLVKENSSKRIDPRKR